MFFSKARQDFVQTSCKDFLVIKQEDQKFRHLHEVEKLKIKISYQPIKKGVPYL